VDIDILIFDGVDELDAVAPYEVLRRAERATASARVRLVHANGVTAVVGSCGLRFEVDTRFEPGEADILIVPGGGWATKSPVGAWAEHERGQLEPLIAQAKTPTSTMAGVCTGTMLLAYAGLASGRRANTHHSAAGELASLGVDVVSDRVVDDGDLVTCGGVTSGIDLALWLVEREIDPTLADRIAVGMEYRRERPSLVR